MAGLILFPLACLFCLLGFVVLQAFNEGSDRPFDAAMGFSSMYGVGALLCGLGFLACLIAFLKSPRRP